MQSPYVIRSHPPSTAPGAATEHMCGHWPRGSHPPLPRYLLNSSGHIILRPAYQLTEPLAHMRFAQRRVNKAQETQHSTVYLNSAVAKAILPRERRRSFLLHQPNPGVNPLLTAHDFFMSSVLINNSSAGR